MYFIDICQVRYFMEKNKKQLTTALKALFILKVSRIQPDDIPQKHTYTRWSIPSTTHKRTYDSTDTEESTTLHAKYRGYYQFTALVHPGDYKLNTKNTKGWSAHLEHRLFPVPVYWGWHEKASVWVELSSSPSSNNQEELSKTWGYHAVYLRLVLQLSEVKDPRM